MNRSALRTGFRFAKNLNGALATLAAATAAFFVARPENFKAAAPAFPARRIGCDLTSPRIGLNPAVVQFRLVQFCAIRDEL